MKELSIIENHPPIEQTAYGLLSDLVAVAAESRLDLILEIGRSKRFERKTSEGCLGRPTSLAGPTPEEETNQELSQGGPYQHSVKGSGHWIGSRKMGGERILIRNEVPIVCYR